MIEFLFTAGRLPEQIKEPSMKAVPAAETVGLLHA